MITATDINQAVKNLKKQESPLSTFLEYEIANSWICQWIWIDWVQDFWAKRMANKAMRKYKKYVHFVGKVEMLKRAVS